MPQIDTQWWITNWPFILLALMFAKDFLNNLLARVPSLKSNTIFECIYNSLDALVATVKKTKEAPPDEKVISDVPADLVP
jgi:hypothetical protein